MKKTVALLTLFLSLYLSICLFASCSTNESDTESQSSDLEETTADMLSDYDVMPINECLPEGYTNRIAYRYMDFQLSELAYVTDKDPEYPDEKVVYLYDPLSVESNDGYKYIVIQPDSFMPGYDGDIDYIGFRISTSPGYENWFRSQRDHVMSSTQISQVESYGAKVPEIIFRAFEEKWLWLYDPVSEANDESYNYYEKTIVTNYSGREAVEHHYKYRVSKAEDPIYAEYTVIPSTSERGEHYCNELTAEGAEIPEKYYIRNEGNPIEIYCYDPVNEINDSNYQYLKKYNPGMSPYISMAHIIMYYRVPISNITE